MCLAAHGEQCRMAEVSPNGTHCNVTGNSLWYFFFLLAKYKIYVTQVFDIGDLVLCTAAVRHRELSGVVGQPSVRRGAAGDGWGELCRRYQLCFCKPQTADVVFMVRFPHVSENVATFLYFCAAYCVWQGFSSRVRLFLETHKSNVVIVLPQTLHNANISLSIFLCLEKVLFPKLAIFTGPADGRGHHGWVTFGFRPGLLIKPVVSQCRPLLHGMFFKHS